MDINVLDKLEVSQIVLYSVEMVLELEHSNVIMVAKLDVLIVLLNLDIIVLHQEMDHLVLPSVEIIKDMALRNVIMEIKLDVLIALLILVIHALVKLELLLVALQVYAGILFVEKDKNVIMVIIQVVSIAKLLQVIIVLQTLAKILLVILFVEME